MVPLVLPFRLCRTSSARNFPTRRRSQFCSTRSCSSSPNSDAPACTSELLHATVSTPHTVSHRACAGESHTTGPDFFGLGVPKSWDARFFPSAHGFSSASRLQLSSVRSYCSLSPRKSTTLKLRGVDVRVPLSPELDLRATHTSVGACDAGVAPSVAKSVRSPGFVTYEEARQFIRTAHPNVKNSVDWKKWSMTTLRPSLIPGRPDITYQGRGWTSWFDFLGYPRPEQLMSYAEARTFIRKFGFKSQSEWRTWSQQPPNLRKRPTFIPANPYQTYKGKGWVSWYDFLGHVPRVTAHARLGDSPPSQHSRSVCEASRSKQEFVEFVGRERPEFKLVALPWGFVATHLLSIVDPERPSDAWTPLILRFTRPRSEAAGSGTGLYLIQYTRSQIGLDAIIVSSGGGVCYSRGSDRHADAIRSKGQIPERYNTSLRASDFKPREDVFELLSELWKSGQHRRQTDWLTCETLCHNVCKTKFQRSFMNLRASFLDPLGISVRMAPSSTNSSATLLLGDRSRVSLRTAQKRKGGWFSASVAVSAGWTNVKRPVRLDDQIDYFIFAIPAEFLAPGRVVDGQFHCMMVPRAFALSEGWISSGPASSASGSGLLTAMLYPPYLDLSSCPERAAKQARQSQFYVSNVEEFAALWKKLQLSESEQRAGV